MYYKMGREIENLDRKFGQATLSCANVLSSCSSPFFFFFFYPFLQYAYIYALVGLIRYTAYKGHFVNAYNYARRILSSACIIDNLPPIDISVAYFVCLNFGNPLFYLESALVRVRFGITFPLLSACSLKVIKEVKLIKCRLNRFFSLWSHSKATMP